MRILSTAAAAIAALTTAACIETTQTASLAPVARPAPVAPVAPTSAATWSMPWQISPSSARSASAGEETSLAFVPGTGYVRGTRAALASLGTPLAGRPGPNATLNACRNVVQSEAVKVGARDVEAVSAGPHRRMPNGQFVAPVEMRITYPIAGGYEVRRSTLTCIVDAQGKIVDAFAAEA